MMKPGRSLPLSGAILLLAVSAVVSAQSAGSTSALRVVSAGPTGEVASLADANEIRVVFSEPMVDLGRIPSPVTAPFFHMSPKVAGTFRWSGTTILVFTPDPKRPLPRATSYEVTIDTTARAVSGRALPGAFTFTFTTPTVHLLRPAWSRRGGTIDGPILVFLRFNQPVRPSDVVAHLSAHFQKHAWVVPVMPLDSQARARAIDPTSVDHFNAKVAATTAVAEANGPVQLKLATDWDKKRYPPSPDLVVLESVTTVPPESWTRLTLDDKLPSPAGTATPGRAQDYFVQAERAFFVDGFACSHRMRSRELQPPQDATAGQSLGICKSDLGGRHHDGGAWSSRFPKLKAPKPSRRPDLDAAPALTLEDAGFDAQPPAKTYAVTLDANGTVG